MFVVYSSSTVFVGAGVRLDTNGKNVEVFFFIIFAVSI